MPTVTMRPGVTTAAAAPPSPTPTSAISTSVISSIAGSCAPEDLARGGLPRGGESGVVVRLGRDLLDVLRVLHLAVLAHDEDRARRQPAQGPILDQDAVALREVVVAK